ncbi:MAG: hypothetical protein IT442_03080 [Phycisphaeraceae bacterium]|nr:hypothetical protein [Phycisphaeraceae bacterium]
MPELIRQGRVYIAQPPLYQVTRGKKSEYVLNEKRMHAVLTGLGLEGTELVVFDADHREKLRLSATSLAQALDLLTQIQDIAHILSRRGIVFEEFLALRSHDPEGKGRLPRIRLQIPDRLDHDHYFWSEAEEERFRAEHDLQESDPELDKVLASDGGEPGQPSEQATSATPARAAMRKELHEVRELERLFMRLADEFGLSIDDWALSQVELPSGELASTRFELTRIDAKGQTKVNPVVNLSQVTHAVVELGKEGLEIKRFKGLGEMDAEQLWETTMNPANRVLLRVAWDAASEAEQLFTILMGEEVEPRRKYIEDHALEVKNLDV